MSTPSSTPEGPSPEEPKKKDTLVDYFRLHTRETVAYILLILGIILLFFQPLIGGILVGIIAGIYFGDELVAYLTHWNDNVHTERVAKHLILIGVAIAFFISAPAIFLGIAIAIIIKQLFISSASSGL